MRLLLLFFAALCTLFTAPAQQPFFRDIPLTEGGTPLRVNDMVFDETGCLWLGAEQGLYRYNGRTIAEEPPNSARRAVTALARRGGALFVGFRDGNVLVLRGKKAQRVFGTASSAITCLLPTSFGLLVGTAGEGIALVRAGVVYRMTTETGLSDDYVYSIVLDAPQTSDPRGPRLLAGTDRGISIISLEKSRLRCSILNTANTPALRDNIVRVIRQLPGADAQFIVGTQSAGSSLLLSAGNSWRALRIPDSNNAEVSDIFATHSGATLLACSDGLHELQDFQPSRKTLDGRAIHRILQGPTGALWLATSDGLVGHSALFLETLDPGSSYALRELSALTNDTAGVLWYAQGKTLYSYIPSTGARLHFNASASITSLYTDARNRLWIGTLGGGLLCRENGAVQTVTNIDNLRGGHILHIAGRGDTLWVSSLNGVEELFVPAGESSTPHALRHHGRATGAGSDYIYRLYPDRRGRLWMATDGAGVVMWDGRRYHHWDTSTGFVPRVVYSVVEDARGAIWAGTLEGGLLRWDGKGWRAFRREHGLQSNTILSLAALRDGSVVAVNESGVDQWLPESGEFRQYGRRMGLHIDSFSNMLNAATADTAGAVVLPYEHGFLVVKPAEQPTDFRPRIALSAVELFSKPIDTSRHRFAPDENSIGFRWEGIHFASPERLHYRYRLRGYGQDWVETRDESITFPRLPAGRYAFEVEAALSADFSRAARAHYAFQIAAPLWKRWWTWVLLATGCAGTGYLLLQRRDHARQRLAMLQQARLRAEYEGLKSQVNPHFLFNSLNTLVSLIEEDPTSAAHYTEQLSDLYRDTLAFRSRDLVTLAEEWAVLQKYLYIQQSRFGEALRVEAAFEDDLLHKGKVIPLALQLLVENAIKHNEVSRAHPLTIAISATHDSITVSNALRPKASREKGTGIGLENIRNRYALLTTRTISASRTGGQFTVTLPLL